MTTPRPARALRAPRAGRALALLLSATALSLSGGLGVTPAEAAPAPALKAADGWVDGGDEFPCLDDVTCLWIENCELDENQHPVYPNRNGTTSYPAGTYSYADEQPTTPTPTPTTPTPTTPTPGTGGGGTGGGGTGGGGTGTGGGATGGGTTTPPTTTPGTTDPTTVDPTTVDPTTVDPTAVDPTTGLPTGTPTEVAPPGAPSALAAPTLTVKGRTVTVSWVASPNAELEQVTGYLVRFTGLAAVETDATTLSYEFPNLKPGSYRAAVWAKNVAGESLGSPPSEPVVVGTDPVAVPGQVAVTGDVVPGATVTLTGTGFAPRIEGFELELHSDPLPLGSVNTDDRGGFTTQVVLPANVTPGEHEVVVLFGGKQVSRSPVTVLAPGAVAATTTDTDGPATDTAAAASSADPVPDSAGLVILGGLAGAGLLALLWRGLRGRRRPSVTVTAPAGVATAP